MVCPPLWWCSEQGACAGPCFCPQHPAFAPGSSEMAVGFLVFLYLVHNLPQLCMHAVIFSPLWFLCILLLEKVFVWVQALQQRVPDPRSQSVSIELLRHLCFSEIYSLLPTFEANLVPVESMASRGLSSFCLVDLGVIRLTLNLSKLPCIVGSPEFCDQGAPEHLL